MKKCPQTNCGRVEEDMHECGSFLTCPKKAVPVEATDVVLRCDVCDLTRCIPAARIMQGKGFSGAHMCPQAECAAKPIVSSKPQPAPKKADRGEAQS